MKNSFRIAEISFGRSIWNSNYEFVYNDCRFEVQRFGAQFSVDFVQKTIENMRTQVDAFALTSLPSYIKLDGRSYVHRQYLDIIGTPCSVPLCDGSGLKEIGNLSTLHQLIKEKKVNPEDGVFFPMAVLTMELVEWLRKKFPRDLQFGDAYTVLGIPWVVRSFPGFTSLAKLSLNIANIKDLRNSTPVAESQLQKTFRTLVTKQVEYTKYICADLPVLMLFDANLDFVKDKHVITWTHNPLMETELRKYEPASIIQLFPEKFNISPHINYPVLDACLRLSEGRSTPFTIEECERIFETATEIRGIGRELSQIKKISTQAKLSKSFYKVKSRLKKKPDPDFAFIIHALSHRDLMRVPGLSVLNHLPSKWNYSVDRMISQAPPILYGEVKHVISQSTGKEINGLIYGLFSTPQVLKSKNPEIVYDQIQNICENAMQRGARLIGLGAYTKIVGDQGLTINQNSPIPVTTGNSLSASSTLWALHEVIRKMGLLSIDSQTGKVNGMAMVIGATGSIGKVSAKLLSLVFRKLCLVAPRVNRLEELKKEIHAISPQCEVIISTEADSMAHATDALVTATSSFDHKIIDVERLKPGCVVCDCSRPLDFDLEDAMKRPDILIIESGEVVLPGPYRITCDLGLPGKSVYACLAETALLALEERYEPFTMGRDIEWTKVKEIYRMARRHGVQLASIQGHMGTLTDKEIQLTRELALSRLRRS